jgi:uncharacterized membrane protein YgcG
MTGKPCDVVVVLMMMMMMMMTGTVSETTAAKMTVQRVTDRTAIRTALLDALQWRVIVRSNDVVATR